MDRNLSPEEITYISRMLGKKKIAEIAKDLGRHYNTVYNIAMNKLGHKSEAHYFTPEEDKFILENSNNLRTDVIARTLGVSREQIYNRRANLMRKMNRGT